jgi:hypothetical protein
MMTKKNAARRDPSRRDDEQKLDSRYGRIGISAVAAALPYRGDSKSPEVDGTSARRRLELWMAERAA